ncbi:two-component sensor histidine kinase [Dactylosporangium aurantiacum]|uniref:histidine kinase n=1 Tax=Dactylosporangium aurantiacum TaxID=35754 RepID=A0A9Q9IBF2_9ACTN|nr:histidine kinase [Dactylosporangium aurantiacum]MDG6109288.1 histidine kinase [Dactylosporangium aurantiacum]UWZ50374.1 two-component sensor histidine kinase [Dactylosporangium aurantiacum]
MISAKGPAWASCGRYGLVLLLAAVAVQNGAASAGGHYLTPRTAVAVVCASVLLVARVPWFVAAAATTAAAGLWGWPMLPLLLVALFDMAASRRVAAAAVCCGVVLAANTVAPGPVSLWRPQAYGASLFLLLAVVMGLWMGSRRRLVQALHEQVDHLRVERQLREETVRAAERSRIAADMHDVLAHRLSLIALHTGVLTTRAGALPAPVAERLTLLRTAATEALADLRDVLAALHDRQATTGDAATAPVLRDVRELVDQARAAGQDVDLRVQGSAEQASAAHRLALYRLVQEGLTNARKHAAGAPVRVRVDYGPPHTVVEVTNGPGRPAGTTAASGFGLIGLRERVQALGGQLSAGPHGAGSWQLTARIPHPAPIDQDGAHR